MRLPELPFYCLCRCRRHKTFFPVYAESLLVTSLYALSISVPTLPTIIYTAKKNLCLELREPLSIWYTFLESVNDVL